MIGELCSLSQLAPISHQYYYNSIQKIDKTNFNPTKGYFTITCKGDDGREVVHKISSKDYDNLQAVLDLLVAKIS